MENPTRHKIREAQYFVSMMKQAFEDDNTFSHNLSAFLSAARSTTFYMQKQYKHQEGFDEWYRQKQIEMSKDPELDYLNEVRVEDVHREPVRTGATRLVTFRADAILVKEGTPKVQQAKEAEPKQSSPKTVRRFFPKFGRVDVIEFCENQLTKLTEIVEECENRFL